MLFSTGPQRYQSSCANLDLAYNCVKYEKLGCLDIKLSNRIGQNRIIHLLERNVLYLFLPFISKKQQITSTLR